MGRCAVVCVIGAALALSTGCASVPVASDGSQERGPKVLLEWADKKSSPPSSNGEKSDSAEKGSGAGADSTAPQRATEEPDEIVTDRPDFTEASRTVGKGRVQLEAGYTFTRDRTNGERFSSHSYPEALLRVGMFADWFEFRLGQNFGNERTILADGTRTRASGADDLYLGVKLGLTEQKAWRPEMALVLQITVPTGSNDFSSREVLPGLNLLYGWDVIKDRVSVGGSTQANRVRGDFPLPDFMGLDQATTGKHSYLLLAQSLTVNYTLTEKLGAYTEWFAFFPHSAIGPDIGPEHYLDGGFTYELTPTFQLDIRAGVGLNRHAADFFAGTGFAVKY
jgi:hypothetical protein